MIHVDSGGDGSGAGAAGKAEKRRELHFSMFSNTREIFDLIEQLVMTAVTE